MPKISIIIPCYYNELNIPITSKVLIEREQYFPPNTEIEYVMVNDGSKDKTLEKLLEFKQNYPDRIKIINLARNFGANNASLCGINYATGDCCVILAADLQDPPELIPQMYAYWQQGCKLVLAQKTDREDTLLTKLFSNTFHTLIRRFALSNAPQGGFDLWLFDRQLQQAVININEKNAYLPYVFMWLGYPYMAIPYTRRKRELGKSGWTLSKKVKSFIDSFVAFSFLPIRLISTIGLLLGFAAMLYGVFIVIAKLNGNIEVQGWTSMMLVFLLISSFQMIALGIIGEYLWRTLDQVRNRPNYIVEKEYI